MQAITFADFFLADILTSMSKVGNCCSLINNFQDPLSTHNSDSTIEKGVMVQLGFYGRSNVVLVRA